MSLELPGVLYTNILTLVSLVNTLTEGSQRAKPYVVPAAKGERIALALQAIDVDGDRYVVKTLKSAQSEALFELAQELRGIVEGGQERAPQQVNALLTKYQAMPVLLADDDGSFRLHFHSPMAGPAARRGAGTATALAALIEIDQFHRLGVCDATSCDRIYFDTSRNASKRFCSNACLNRTKTSLFRERRLAQASG